MKMANPTVTYALMCYQHVPYVARAVRSALRQQGRPLDILISDDASTDGTVAEIEKAIADYRGPHRVRLNRNETNMGMAHFNRLLELAEGDYIVIAHGDDYSKTDRTRKLMEIFERERVTFVSSNCQVMTRNGDAMGVIGGMESGRMTAEEMILRGWQPTMLGASHAFHRDLLVRFKGVDPLYLPVSYDLPFPFRGALLDGAYYCGEELVAWRRHGQNMTDRLLRATGTLDQQAEAMIASHLTEQFGMMHDLDTLMAAVPERKAELHALRNKLAKVMLYTTGRWVRMRNELMTKGLLPGWAPAEAFNGDPERYSGHELSPLVEKFVQMTSEAARGPQTTALGPVRQRLGSYLRRKKAGP